MHNRILEIESYLIHRDHSLAVRRILDMSLDTGDQALMQAAIAFSRRYRSFPQDDIPDAFYDSAKELLGSLSEGADRLHENPRQLLSANNISKVYRSGNFTLHSISLQLFSGSVLGVVGQNGHGKTTLLRCIAGQLALTTGELSYPLLNHPDHFAIKQHVSFVPQRIPKWYGLLKDNLHFSAALSGIEDRENEVMVDFMLERLGLGKYAHLSWAQISSGYRTRFELARILLQKPKLLILDEPLANLDINAQQTILTDLRFMAKSVQHPMGVILSSQQLHEVEKVADSVLLIKEGKCLFRTGDANTAGVTVVELETTASRETIALAMGAGAVIHFNGGFYTITSTENSVQDVAMKLVNEGIAFTYFRDITHSTKRYL